MDEIIAHEDNTWSVGIKHPQQKGTEYTRSDLIPDMLDEAERKGRMDMLAEAAKVRAYTVKALREENARLRDALKECEDKPKELGE